jgi:hypothetical protein
MEVMKAGATFVVADVGHPPRWIDPAHRFEFWKTEVKPRLAVQHAFLEDYPGGIAISRRNGISPMGFH